MDDAGDARAGQAEAPLPAWARPRPIWAAGLSVLALVALVLLLWRAREVVSWLGLALLLALTLDLPMRGLQGRGLPRWAAVLIVVGSALVLFVALIVYFTPKLAAQMHLFLVERGAHGGPPVDPPRGELVPWLTAHLHGLRQLGHSLAAHGGNLTTSLLHLARTATRDVFAALTVFVLAAYLLVSGAGLFEGLLAWLPAERRSRWRRLGEQIRWVVGRYVTAVFIRAAVLGVASAATLAVMRVPYFLPVGLVLIVLGLLPIIGPILGGVVMVAAAASHAGAQGGLLALGLFVLFQQLDSHLVSPLAQRYTLKMNPVVTMVASLVGITAGGVLGAALALPIAAVLQLVARDLRPAAPPGPEA